MAAIDDLIAQVEDRALRERLRTEAQRLIKEKKFGLVFEEHLPEVTPIYSMLVRAGNHVAPRGQAVSHTWRVLAISNGMADCLNPTTGQWRRLWPSTSSLPVAQRGAK